MFGMTYCWQRWYLQCAIASSAWVGGAIALGDYALAQITPDTTLGRENSTVTSIGSADQIAGGATRGANLFHSFQEFNVNEGRGAVFTNPPGVENILSRVTGANPSNILGTLGVLGGNANLFLINPNGIIFGPNARLDVGGSFVATTANAVGLASGGVFSANPTEPLPTGLLNVNPNALLFNQIATQAKAIVNRSNGETAGEIRVQGSGHNQTTSGIPPFSPVIRGSNLNGLRVQPGKTLALVGGDVVLEGGILTAEQGRIELGSVGDGLVSISPTTNGWTLGYEGVQSFQNIQLSQRALADASGSGGGDIQLSGRRIALTGSSSVLIQNQGFEPAGAISVNAFESLELIDSLLFNEPLSVGNGGEIAVSAKRLVLQDGGVIATRTFSAATGGKLTVNASESVQIIGVSPLDPRILSSLTTIALSSGDAGDITMTTGRLTALKGGVVTSATLGTGFGGDVTVNATDFVELIGVQPIVFVPGAVSASAFNAGNAGRLTINTSRLVVRDGGRVDSSTAGSGSAGSVTIEASESVEVSGTVPSSRNPSLIVSSANIGDTVFLQAFGLPPVPSGASGDVTINTGRLSVTDGALVNVRNDGSGNAGTLWVNARSIVLNNGGGITAATTLGAGGNIFLQVQNLRLGDNSAITATAGGTGNGGNITIDTDTLVALGNSDITANAQQAYGGQVIIDAQAFFRTQDSDITATSELGPQFSGTVEINTPDVDLDRGLVNLPTQPVNTEVVQACQPGGNQQQSEFVITGRGGLPSNPGEALSTDAVQVDLITLNSEVERSASTAVSMNPTRSTPARLVEAQSWVIDANGNVVLTTNASSVSPRASWQKTSDCQRNES